MAREELTAKVADLPTSPGVYLLKDGAGRILYAGKASNLRARVRTYLDDATAAARHTVQYFEVLGSRAIYKDGWWACARLDKIPWDMSPATMRRFAPGVYDPEKDVWELYYLPDDFSQAKA